MQIKWILRAAQRQTAKTLLRIRRLLTIISAKKKMEIYDANLCFYSLLTKLTYTLFETYVTLDGISGNKVNARTRHAPTLKQKN